MYTTSRILMIRPVKFACNPQTLESNAFQSNVDLNDETVQEQALEQFDAFVLKLRENGVDVTVVNDTPEPHTPDSIFPNNWITSYDDGSIILHPMESLNRRAERKPHVLAEIEEKFEITKTISHVHYEEKNQFLEGTGSVLLDRRNKIAYTALSSRTHPDVLKEYCDLINFKCIMFRSLDLEGREVYHTNVMLCIADCYAVICAESIRDENERIAVIESLADSGKDIIYISMDQMYKFAGNVLQLQNGSTGERILVMSSQAYNGLDAEQIKTIENYNKIVHSNVDVIESNGGGSARCMMAEIFLPLK